MTGTAPLPGVAAGSAPSAALTREPARDTLAPSSFGVIGSAKPAPPPASAPLRPARAPLPTLGELEGASATATLRPPGAVPPPPRALPTSAPNLDAIALGTAAPLETPIPGRLGERTTGALPGAPSSTSASPSATLASGAAEPPLAPHPSLDSTLDMSGSASKKAAQAALIEQSRVSTVPAPGLYIADEPVEPRPKLQSVTTEQRAVVTRLRAIVLVLGGLFLMALGALVVMIFRRSEAQAPRGPMPSATNTPPAPGCRIAQIPSRISAIERAVPISTALRGDGTLALGIAETKTTASGWIFDPLSGETRQRLSVPPGTGEVTYVTPSEPLVVDRATPEFAFARTLLPSVALGVGPAGILRRGPDGATGVVWPLASGVRITPPRVASAKDRHFVAFRQGGAEGQMLTGWLRSDGTSESDPLPLTGAPKTLGTPAVTIGTGEAVVVFAAREEKSQPYRVHAARAALGKPAAAAKPLDLPAEGGGAIAPSLTPFGKDAYLVQWTDGNVGQYQVHLRILDAELKPLGEAVRVSAKGANAGQGTVVVASNAVVSFFIQTTAGHDELWGATLACR